jgi:hypothetical protein
MTADDGVSCTPAVANANAIVTEPDVLEATVADALALLKATDVVAAAAAPCPLNTTSTVPVSDTARLPKRSYPLKLKAMPSPATKSSDGGDVMSIVLIPRAVQLNTIDESVAPAGVLGEATSENVCGPEIVVRSDRTEPPDGDTATLSTVPALASTPLKKQSPVLTTPTSADDSAPEYVT